VNSIRVALVSGFFAIAACASPPPEEVYVETHRIGLFAVRGTEIDADKITENRFLRDVDAHNMPQNRALAVNRRKLLKETHEIPAVLGTRFGVSFKLTSKPPRSKVRLDVVMNTPPITNPQTGETFSTSKYSRTFPTNRKRTVGYGFDRDWELVPGTWTLQLIHEEAVIFETDFLVVSP
jgi:hypothetical protein